MTDDGLSGGSAASAASTKDKTPFLSDSHEVKKHFNTTTMGGKAIPANKKFAQAQGYVVINMGVERNLRGKRKQISNRSSDAKVLFPEGLNGDYNIDQYDLLFVSHQKTKKKTVDVKKVFDVGSSSSEDSKKKENAKEMSLMLETETVAPSTAMPDGVYACFNGMSSVEEPRFVGFATTNYVCNGPNMHADMAIAMGLQGVMTGYSGPENIEAGDTLYWDYPDMKLSISSASKSELTADDFLMRNYVDQVGPSKIKPVLRPYRVKSDGVTNIASNWKRFVAKMQAEADNAAGSAGSAGKKKPDDKDPLAVIDSMSPSPKAKQLLLQCFATIKDGMSKDVSFGLLGLMLQAAAEHYAFIKSRTVGKALNSCLANSNGLIVMVGIGREV